MIKPHEPTQEDVAKVLGMYLGCKIKVYSSNMPIVQTLTLTPDYLYAPDGIKLLLKPISEGVNDDDLLRTIGKIIHKDAKMLPDYAYPKRVGQAFISTMGMKNDDRNQNIHVYQYLVSKGYDVSHYLLGFKTLKEFGLAEYH